MKKIFLYMACLSLLMTALASCGDNEDFSALHTLTAKEQAELDRQQHIRDSLLNKLPVNFEFDYEANITISSTSYDGTSVKIETDKIAEKLGLTEAQLLAGIAGEAGAPEVKGFAIEGSTHADNGTASTTNAPWGHWWNANNDVTNWGETAMIFCEFDTETSSFNVGQYPGHLTEGDTLEVAECLKYNGIRIGVVIKVIAVAPGKITAPIVRTQELSIDVLAKSTYDQDPLKFNLTQALSDLGITTMEGVKFVAAKEDGSLTQEATAPTTGFWYDKNGYASVWDETTSSFFIYYGDFAADEIGIGQFPGHMQGGQTLVLQYGFMANNKIVMLKITVNVKAYQDPETPLAGDPKAIEQAVNLSKVYSNDYATVKFDVKDLLRDAFKKTTYQIHQAILSGELKLYQGTVSETAPSYTADAPGYWFKADGTTATWAEGLVWCSLGHSETELYLFGGNHPDNAVAGNAVTTKLIATYNGGSATFNITFTLTAP